MTPPPFKRVIPSRRRGLTLVEIMIALFVLTIGMVSFIATFGSVSKSIRVSKARTLATNLAQEEIESLKNLSYYRLLVTTASTPATEAGLGGFFYDQGYYPPERLTVGQINFERRILVRKVTESGSAIIPNAWNSADTGLKLITTYVIWQEGNDWRKVEVNNLRDNPNRQKLDATVTGQARSGGFPLSDVRVYPIQNLLYGDTTDGSGDFTFKVPAGSYDFVASKRGYFSSTITSTVPASGSVTLNYTLNPMGVGSVAGFAYIADHIVISEVSANVNGDDQVEYVELYNPTDQPVMMYNAGVPSYRIEFKRTSTGVMTDVSPPATTIYASQFIQPNGYFLIASSPTVKGVAADAYYGDATRTIPTPGDRIMKEVGGGIRLISEGVNESSGTTVDAIGWGRGSPPYGPNDFREGNGLLLVGGPGNNGMAPEESIERLAFSSSTHNTLDPFGTHANNGNGFDSNLNESDWVHHAHDLETPQNSTMLETRGAGTPAIGAAAFMDDGLSASAVSVALGSFTVQNVATGTFNLVVSSRGYVYEQNNIVITAASQFNVGNVFISTPATRGYISGRVVNAGGTPLQLIKVESSFGTADYTDPAGLYRFNIEGGTHIVTANRNNLNPLYTAQEATGVVVNAGEAVTVSDIYLLQGGTAIGFVSSNGTDPLPGIPIIATNSVNAEVGSTVTDTYGYFRFPNLPIGTYGLTPQLETGESASPSIMTTNITAGSSLFVGTMTVSNAFGTIEGTVQAGGRPVTTGVLIVAVASPNTIASSLPPVNNQTLRNGSVVYYIGSSNSDGTYAVPVRGGVTYNVYAWYTTFNGSTANPQKRSGTATLPAGGTGVVNFTW